MTLPPIPLPSPANTAAIIVAAGSGSRVGGEVPKQFQPWRGKPLLMHSVDAFRRAGFAQLVVVVAADQLANARELLINETVALVSGDKTRQGSVRNALEALAQTDRAPPEFVLIHDAARPDLPSAVIDRLLAALAQNDAVIPALSVVDSLAISSSGVIEAMQPREGLWRIQTPQAFRFHAVLEAHRKWQGAPDAGDDSAIMRANNVDTAIVAGDESLRKITFARDFVPMHAAIPSVRTGIGYDVHRLGDGEGLWLCGIYIAHNQSLIGHSDADVALHAITDALLGALSAGDIGDHFPPSDPQWRGASSDRFLSHAASLLGTAEISHIDLTIICEAPRIGPHKQAMRARIAEILGLDIAAVSVKATTTERLGFTGRGEGIAAQAIVTVQAG